MWGEENDRLEDGPTEKKDSPRRWGLSLGVRGTQDYLLLSSTDSLMSWKVASMSLSRPMLKRMRPSLMPISFWMSSGTSELVLLPLLLKRVLK